MGTKYEYTFQDESEGLEDLLAEWGDCADSYDEGKLVRRLVNAAYLRGKSSTQNQLPFAGPAIVGVPGPSLPPPGAVFWTSKLPPGVEVYRCQSVADVRGILGDDPGFGPEHFPVELRRFQ